MTLRFIDWIWHVRGSLALAPQQTSDAFARLAPLFGQAGTSHDRTQDTLTFRKKDPAAQDKMSIFNAGVLQIENGSAGPVLRYHLTSRWRCRPSDRTAPLAQLSSPVHRTRADAALSGPA